MLSQSEKKINYAEIIKTYPWIVEKEHDCILSPDSDGLLCGLFMSHFLGLKIKGFYDGKALILKQGISSKNCIFLDMDIFRKEIKSVGHHMVLYNKKNVPKNWENFENCIQPNNIRNFDFHENFKLKYPLATIHLLLGIIGSIEKIKINKNAICPLLYTDGVFKNLFNYPENCLDWITFLDGNAANNTLYEIFFNTHYLVSDLMIALKDFFNTLSNLGEATRGNDKIKISDSRGNIVNLTQANDTYRINDEEKNKSIKFLKILSSLTEWEFKENTWTWDSFNLFQFTKKIIKPNKTQYNNMIYENPISLAMTANTDGGLQYTLETPNNLK